MRWIVGLLVIAGILIYLARQDASTPSTPRPATPQAVAPVATPPPPPLQSPAPPRQPTPDPRLARMQALAPQAGVTLLRFEPEGNGGWLTFRWTGDVAARGMDYIQLLLSEQVVRDFDVEHKTMTEGYTPQGVRFYTARMRVMF